MATFVRGGAPGVAQKAPEQAKSTGRRKYRLELLDHITIFHTWQGQSIDQQRKGWLLSYTFQHPQNWTCEHISFFAVPKIL